MTGWTVAWTFWILMFVAIEVPALFNKQKGDTLSEHLRSWFATRGKPRGWQLRRATLVGMFVWLFLHLFDR